MDEFTITKKIAKYGKQNMILIPKDLEEHLPHKALVEVNIKVKQRPD